VNPKVIRAAEATAKAEGFGPPENLPTRCHNPGDLEVGDVGYGEDNLKTIFPNDSAGWLALEHQWDLMLSGNSHEYKLSDTILDVAFRWTGGDHPNEWAAAFAQELGIPVTMKLSEYLDS
jgi:hypothetical protein